jgi:hypothetical protein
MSKVALPEMSPALAAEVSASLQRMRQLIPHQRVSQLQPTQQVGWLEPVTTFDAAEPEIREIKPGSPEADEFLSRLSPVVVPDLSDKFVPYRGDIPPLKPVQSDPNVTLSETRRRASIIASGYHVVPGLKKLLDAAEKAQVGDKVTVNLDDDPPLNERGFGTSEDE